MGSLNVLTHANPWILSLVVTRNKIFLRGSGQYNKNIVIYLAYAIFPGFFLLKDLENTANEMEFNIL